MIDVAKLDALDHQLRNRHFDGLAPELIEVIGLARLVLASQAAPGEEAPVEAMLRRLEQLGLSGRFSAQTLTDIQTIIPELRLAASRASLHRPVEARVTEGLDALSRPESGSVEEAERAIRNSTARRPFPTVAELQAILDEPASLPSPQVTREEVAKEIARYLGKADALIVADRILSLFGRAR